MFVYKFTMPNLVSVFPRALHHRIREKRIETLLYQNLSEMLVTTLLKQCVIQVTPFQRLGLVRLRYLASLNILIDDMINLLHYEH